MDWIKYSLMPTGFQPSTTVYETSSHSMSNENDILDFPEDYQGPEQDAKEQTLLEQMFSIPAQDNINERMEAIQNAIAETEHALENLKDKTPKEQAHFGRRLQKLKRMLQATKNTFQNPDSQVTQVAPKDLKPVPAKVTFDDDEDAVSIPSAPAPAAWKEKTKAVTKDEATEITPADQNLDTANEEADPESAENEHATEEPLRADSTDEPSEDQSDAAASVASEETPSSEQGDDWEGTEATLQMDAPNFEEKTDDWEGTEATLQMDAPQFNQEQKDWDGTEATLQMDTPHLQKEQKDWDGTEATLQMDAPNMANDDADWEGTEATLTNGCFWRQQKKTMIGAAQK